MSTIIRVVNNAQKPFAFVVVRVEAVSENMRD